MSRGVQWSLFGSAVVAALIALAGCSHYLFAEREPWRRDAEIACLNSGAVKESPERVRISAISGPGICGADFPLRVSALGDSPPLGYDDEPVRPPSAIPNGAMPQQWPVIQSNALPPLPSGPPQYGVAPSTPPPYDAPPPSASPQYGAPPPGSMQTTPGQVYRWQTGPALASQAGPPMSLYAPGVPVPNEDDADYQPGPPRRYDGAPGTPSSMPPPATYPPPVYSSPAYPQRAEPVPLGPPRAPMVTAAGQVEVKPAATLACPIVSALDKWIAAAVQPAALRWFRQPAVEIKQISAYSCRGMNGDPNAHISEHAFGNALDIAEFQLADGHKISVQYGWRGTPEEQGFLHDVQLAACEEFTTVLAPGANVYHYNHIHVDLMRRASGRRICQPAAIPGEVVAERARARYAAQHYGEHFGDPGITGSLKDKPRRALGYSGEDDDRLPLAVPGED
jgi:Extensin-like protein C-terminus